MAQRKKRVAVLYDKLKKSQQEEGNFFRSKFRFVFQGGGNIEFEIVYLNSLVAGSRLADERNI